MTFPLPQEAAKVLFDSFRQSVPWETLGTREQSEYAEAVRLFTRWLLTREPTERMVDAGFDAPPIPPMRAQKQHYAAAYRAMNAALLKEMG